MGQNGLRVQGGLGAKAPLLTSAPMAVEPGKTYRVSFWGKKLDNERAAANVSVVFLDATGQPIEGLKAIRLIPTSGISFAGGFEKQFVGAIAPPGSEKMLVTIQPQGKGAGYLDDFQVETVDEQTKPAIDSEALAREVEADPHRGKPAPKIVIKVDDLATVREDDVIHANWTKFVDYIKEKKIKVGIGLLANSLEADKPKYLAWLKGLLATGQIEIWLHAYDHQSHLVDGKLFPEFSGLSPDEQKARLAKCQQLGKDKLGLAFQTFGPPGQGGIPAGLPPTTPLGVGKTAMDENTLKAIAGDPDFKVVMYPAPVDDLGARLEAGGKVTVLRRVFCVNLENPVFSPNFDIFLEGYAHNRGQDYFVLQGHPKQWDEARFQQFVKIVDFLTDQGAVFVTPSELAASLKPGKTK